MVKKLHSFDINDPLIKGIRYILQYGKIEFEDVTYDRQKWDEENSIAPFGELPLYEDGNEVSINQYLAISRYLGQSLNLGFGDAVKDAQLDAMAIAIYSMFYKGMPVYTAPNSLAKAAAKETFLNKTAVFYYSRFEKQVKDNNGFFFGKLTWVDFVLTGVTEFLDWSLDTQLESRYPQITALFKKIHSYDGVEEHVTPKKSDKYSLNMCRCS